MSRYSDLATANVPQSKPLNKRQVRNNAGGFVFALDDWKRLERFLVLGSDSNTYYQKAPQLTRENAECVARCYDVNPARTINTITLISTAGRAAKNDAAIFALALGAVHKDTLTRQMALEMLPSVCRTSTHLFQFVNNTRALGKGWGRALKRAVANWYDLKSVRSLAFQVIKYREREGVSHKRLVDLSHPAGDGARDTERTALYQWLVRTKGDAKINRNKLPDLVLAHLEAMREDISKKELLRLVEDYKLPWEAISTKWTTDPDVWRVMLPDMGLTALIRNLGRMTKYGTLKPLSSEVREVVKRVTTLDELKKARIHPFNVLLAHATYGKGQGFRGSLSWEPIGAIVDALEEAFYLSFKTVEPSGKRTLIGLDVSGSMSCPLMGSPLEVRTGAAAMAMATVRVEKNWDVYAFDTTFRDLRLSAKDSLEAVLRKTSDWGGGFTDCSLPMQYAMKNKLEVDVFAVYTDNETWAGSIHPSSALRQYREKMGIPAKLVVTGMTATEFTIADPEDPGMLDVVGFDSDAPAVIADFSRG